MKIAAVSDNGVNVSQHFGRAPMYVVVTVEDGKIVAREERLRGGNTCACGQTEQSSGTDCHEGHDHNSTQSQSKHSSMADAIADCNVIIAGGMGYGAYASLKNRNLEPIITDVNDINQAVKLYLEGKLINYMEQLH
jgi:predicted Fe-Mo cluster-binding NifX family protein